MTATPCRLGRVLREFSTGSATHWEWKDLLQEAEWSAWASVFDCENRCARRMRCPHRSSAGCTRLLIEQEEEYVAFCEQSPRVCTELILEESEALVYHLSLPSLYRVVSRCLNHLSGVARPLEENRAVGLLGHDRRPQRSRRPWYLSTRDDPDHLLDMSRWLLEHEKSDMVLVLPTVEAHEDLLPALSRRLAEWYALEDLLQVEECGGRWMITATEPEASSKAHQPSTTAVPRPFLLIQGGHDGESTRITELQGRQILESPSSTRWTFDLTATRLRFSIGGEWESTKRSGLVQLWRTLITHDQALYLNDLRESEYFGRCSPKTIRDYARRLQALLRTIPGVRAEALIHTEGRDLEWRIRWVREAGFPYQILLRLEDGEVF